MTNWNESKYECAYFPRDNGKQQVINALAALVGKIQTNLLPRLRHFFNESHKLGQSH